MADFIKILQHWFTSLESRPFAKFSPNRGLIFAAVFAATFNQPKGDWVNAALERKIELHDIPRSLIDFVLNVAYKDVIIQTRALQFINQILDNLDPDAILENTFVTKLTTFMCERLNDKASPIRVEAIEALRRFQHPENPEDEIIERYLYHLRKDQCPKVRVAILYSIVKCDRTIPAIIFRRRDFDEKVRCYCYMELSKIPMEWYTIRERIVILDEGLFDPSDLIKRAMRGKFLVRWLEYVNGDYMELMRLLKPGDADKEMERFCEIGTETLREFFKGKFVIFFIEIWVFNL